MANQYPNEDLTCFLELIEESTWIKSNRTDREIEDIREAVEEMVEKLLIEMGKNEPRFKNLKDNLLKVGSFYSKAKIGEPDEFDYLVVVDDLSEDETQLEEACVKLPGFRHIILKESSELEKKWSAMLNSKNVIINRGTQRVKKVAEVGDWYSEGRQMRSRVGEGFIVYEHGIRGLFYMCLHKSFQALKRLDRISKPTGKLNLSSYSECFEFVSEEETMYHSKPQRTEIQLYGPATNTLVQWISKRSHSDVLTITVDISPAFRSHIKGTIRMDCIESETIRQALLRQGNFLIIPTAYQCEDGWMDRWVRVLRPFNNISVISRRWKGEHERLCAMKRRLGSGRISPPAGFEPATPWSEVGSANRSAPRTLLSAKKVYVLTSLIPRQKSVLRIICLMCTNDVTNF